VHPLAAGIASLDRIAEAAVPIGLVNSSRSAQCEAMVDFRP
jgi:hypothetical protein